MFQSLLSKVLNVVLSSKKADNKQNWYNDSSAELTAKQLSTKEVTQVVKEVIKHQWCFPVENTKITSPYGWRTLLGKKKWHNGTDYTGLNKFCFAVCDMVIKKVLEPDPIYPVLFEHNGKEWVRIAKIPEGRAWTPYVIAVCLYDETIRFAYKHIACTLAPGTVLKCGDTVGSVGNLGYSMGAHLHIEVQRLKNGEWVNEDADAFFKSKAIV